MSTFSDARISLFEIVEITFSSFLVIVLLRLLDITILVAIYPLPFFTHSTIVPKWMARASIRKQFRMCSISVENQILVRSTKISRMMWRKKPVNFCNFLYIFYFTGPQST